MECVRIRNCINALFTYHERRTKNVLNVAIKINETLHDTHEINMQNNLTYFTIRKAIKIDICI